MSPEKGSSASALIAAATLFWSLAGNLASCFCAALATMTVQVMEKIGYGYEFAAGNLGLAFTDSCQFGLGRLVGGLFDGRKDSTLSAL